MDRLAAALRLTGIGFYIAACILFGVYGGLWLDKKFHNALFIIGGILLGLVVAIYGTYRMIQPLMGNHNGKENG